jgi:hypothetical protein
MRVITDFLRVDRRYLGLTGSQITSIVIGLACIYLLARYRGAPPQWQRAPEGPPEQIVATTESGEPEPEGGLPLRGAEDPEVSDDESPGPTTTEGDQEGV